MQKISFLIHLCYPSVAYEEIRLLFNILKMHQLTAYLSATLLSLHHCINAILQYSNGKIILVDFLVGR